MKRRSEDRRRLQPGDWAWLAVPVYVGVWDAKCSRGQMLSERSQAYRNARPLLWPAVVIYVAGHLIHIWPARKDPLTVLATALGRG